MSESSTGSRRKFALGEPAAVARKKLKHASLELSTSPFTAWLLKGSDPTVDILCADKIFAVPKSVLMNTSEYFNKCLGNKLFKEGQTLTVELRDVNVDYLAFYLGLAHSFSSIVIHTPPEPSTDPLVKCQNVYLRLYIEVFKLCDRFISRKMEAYLRECIKIAIGDSHRALFRASSDEESQRSLMRTFADGFEVLERGSTSQRKLGSLMIRYFCGGINHVCWEKWVVDVVDRPQFICEVSREFAKTLQMYMQPGPKPRRKELEGPLKEPTMANNSMALLTDL